MVSNPCFEVKIDTLASDSVETSCPIEVDPTMAIGVPDLADSVSDKSTLYIVILHVPAVPLEPRTLTFPPLMSAVNVASGVNSAFVMIVLYSWMNASVPSCMTSNSVEETSLEVVLLIDTNDLVSIY